MLVSLYFYARVCMFLCLKYFLCACPYISMPVPIFLCSCPYISILGHILCLCPCVSILVSLYFYAPKISMLVSVWLYALTYSRFVSVCFYAHASMFLCSRKFWIQKILKNIFPMDLKLCIKISWILWWKPFVSWIFEWRIIAKKLKEKGEFACMYPMAVGRWETWALEACWLAGRSFRFLGCV